MKTSDRFNKALAALVKGFFNETLYKGSCSHCAVGNIVGNSKWSHIFMTPIGGDQEFYAPQNADAYEGYAVCLKEITKTGYSIEELARVEAAFEKNTYLFKFSKETKENLLQDQYNGLMAVVDVLCEIEGIDTKEYKDMFSYKCENSKLIKV